MGQPLEFVKLSGSGNDFICMDNRDGRLDPLLADGPRIEHFARTLCRRGLGIGADGLILACTSSGRSDADLDARFLEADGSEAELCGNGTACFTSWVLREGWFQHEEIAIHTPAGIVYGKNSDGQYVRVCIPLPRDMQRDIDVEIAGQRWSCDFVVTGVPHVTVYVPDLKNFDVAHWGPAFRHHERFAPRGVNANFVQVLAPGRIAVRTYEFGVEGETLSCGTGSASAAILTALRYHWPSQYTTGAQPVMVQAASGDVLRVYFTAQADGQVSDLCLDTVVRLAFHGTVHGDLEKMAMEVVSD